MNTISSDLDLSYGAISKAILQKAGKGIQEEISKCYNYNKYGDVIETTGHKLSCRFVYHTICPNRKQAFEKVNTNKAVEIKHKIVILPCS